MTLSQLIAEIQDTLDEKFLTNPLLKIALIPGDEKRALSKWIASQMEHAAKEVMKVIINDETDKIIEKEVEKWMGEKFGIVDTSIFNLSASIIMALESKTRNFLNNEKD